VTAPGAGGGRGCLGAGRAHPLSDGGGIGGGTGADVAESTPAGPDPEPYLELIRKYEEAGFTHVYIHQIGDNQQDFAEFARRELMDRL